MFSLSFMIFLGCLGAGLLLLSVVLDGVLDFFGDEPVLPSLAFFLAMFGFSGALTASAMGDPTVMVYVTVGGVVGLITTAVFFAVYRALKRSADREAEYVPDTTELIGKPVTIDWWRDNRGEVLASWFGTTRRVQAESEENLTAVSTAYITKVVSHNLVHVSAQNPNP